MAELEENPKETLDHRSLIKKGLEGLKVKAKEVKVDFPNDYKIVFRCPDRKQLTEIERDARLEVKKFASGRHPSTRVRAFCKEDPAGAAQCGELARYYMHFEAPNGEIIEELYGWNDFMELAVDSPSFFNNIYQQVSLANFGVDLNAEVNSLVNFTDPTSENSDGSTPPSDTSNDSPGS